MGCHYHPRSEGSRVQKCCVSPHEGGNLGGRAALQELQSWGDGATPGVWGSHPPAPCWLLPLSGPNRKPEGSASLAQSRAELRRVESWGPGAHRITSILGALLRVLAEQTLWSLTSRAASSALQGTRVGGVEVGVFHPALYCQGHTFLKAQVRGCCDHLSFYSQAIPALPAYQLGLGFCKC